MKLMIASDIHGSDLACKKMLEAYEREQCDKLVLLGDILYHGPRNDLPEQYAPKKVIERLNHVKNEILCVGGNCDAYVDQMVLEFPVLAEYAIFYLDQQMVYATHGHKINEENVPPMNKGDILLQGHTHVPVIADRGDYIYLNPGSVAIPKEGHPPTYMTYEDGEFVIKTLDGDDYIRA